ncbi:MAG TPA: prephenate dehydrogenase/arogenate dehydrogenase family protein, partial [Solirubrobacteraceae bacterium]|nr:prephenate dehydrogenase/arogenate dehydrogenase family protein [Solirubrobacteraceae bacterium]
MAVLGVGLIGGSIGLAARARGQAQVTGWDPGWGADPDAREAALRLGAIDVAASDVAGAVEDAQIVFVAAPVGALAETIRAALEAAGPETVVTDVGSTKRVVAEAISDPRFVAGHPLAGGELAGVEHAREDLFERSTWFLCAARGSPAGGQAVEEPRQPVDQLRRPLDRLSQGSLRELIASFGATPVEIEPDAHDRLMATVSQLPHVLANLLVGLAVAAL